MENKSYEEFESMLDAFEGDEEPTAHDIELMREFCEKGLSDIRIRIRVRPEEGSFMEVDGEMPDKAKASILEMALAELIHQEVMEAEKDEERLAILSDHFSNVLGYLNEKVKRYTPDPITC